MTYGCVLTPLVHVAGDLTGVFVFFARDGAEVVIWAVFRF